MKKIDNLADLNLAIKFITSIDNNCSIEEVINKTPESLREIITPECDLIRNRFEIGIFPRNLSVDLFCEVYMTYLQKLVPSFKLDNNSSNAIRTISEYATRNDLFLNDRSRSFDKGLLIMGRVGCGKTIMLSALSNFINLFFYKRQYEFNSINLKTKFIPVYSFVEGFTSKGYDIFSEGIKIGNLNISLMCDLLFIDDIGSENIVSNYGNTTNVIGELILRRYDKKLKTFATTNLDPTTLKTFYGDRVYSRMIEMFNFLILDGYDRRS